MISLPKDYTANIRYSNNYRDICLSSCTPINKPLEFCMVYRYRDKLNKSGLNFYLKPGHSTSMCSLALKELLSYYRNGKFKVYACVMGALKDLDKIRQDKLFIIR